MPINVRYISRFLGSLAAELRNRVQRRQSGLLCLSLLLVAVLGVTPARSRAQEAVPSPSASAAASAVAPAGSPSPGSIPSSPSPSPATEHAASASDERSSGASAQVKEKIGLLKKGSISIDEFVQFVIDESVADSGVLRAVEPSIADLPGVERIAQPLLQKRVLRELPTVEPEQIDRFRSISDVLLKADEDAAASYRGVLGQFSAVVAAATAANWVDAGTRLQAVKSSAERTALSLNVAKRFQSRIDGAQSGAQACEALSGAMGLAGNVGAEQLVPLVEQLLQRLNTLLSAPGGTLSSSTASSNTAYSNTLPADCVLDTKPGIAFLRSAVAARQSLKPAAIQLLDARLRGNLATGDPERLIDLYTFLLELRPDPDPANQELRLWIVLHADAPSAREFALGRFQEMKYTGALPVATRFRLLMKGYYGKAFPYLILGTAVVALLCVVIVMFRPLFVVSVAEVVARKESASGASAAQASAAPGGGKGRGPGGPGGAGPATATGRPGGRRGPTRIFKRGADRPVPGYMRGPVEDDEYTRLLKILDPELDDSASESRIKKAYREKVKKLHPDTKPGEVSEDQSEFIELKEVYDRILQIRSSWFGVKK